MPQLGGDPLEFLEETYHAKTRGMGLLYVEHFTILSSTVLTENRQTIAYSALSICCMLSRAKNNEVH